MTNLSADKIERILQIEVENMITLFSVEQYKNFSIKPKTFTCMQLKVLMHRVNYVLHKYLFSCKDQTLNVLWYNFALRYLFIA